MKKFTKTCLILSAVIGVIGAGLFLAGMIIGPDWSVLKDKGIQYFGWAEKVNVLTDAKGFDTDGLETIYAKLDTEAKQEYEYHGLSDCTMVNMMQDGGPKACSYGCLGDGSCVQACPFDAIHIVNGVAVVDKEACKACGKCVAVCPKHLIEIVPYDQKHLVKCNSQDKGKAVMQACTAGCIGCKMCEKACKFEAVTVENNIAHIDYEKCKDCGACAVKCPKKVIS